MDRYDAATRLAADHMTSDFAFDFSYDAIGNRLTYDVDDSGSATTYTANDVNEYLSTSGPTVDFDHDADGNLTDDDTLTYEYDAGNRLVAVYPVSPSSMNDHRSVYKYDYTGRRVQTTVYAWSAGSSACTPVISVVTLVSQG